MENHYAIIDSNNSVFTVGRNNKGQLGIGNKQDRDLPVKIENLPPIVATSVGREFILFLDDEGFVWVSGSLCDFEAVVPQKVEGVSKIGKICSGDHHCLLLDNDGNVFSFGLNTFGQLGRTEVEDEDEDENEVEYEDVYVYEDERTPMKIGNIPKIGNICCGKWHSILIDIEGNCYTFGNNRSGQLGLGNTTKTSKPTKIEGLPTIHSSSAGSYYTILVTEDNTVYGFGHINLRKLLGRNVGFNPSRGNLLVPIEIKIDSTDVGILRFKKSYCCGYSTILQDTDDNFWAFGQNLYGNLGLGHKRTVTIPTKITALSQIDSILCFEYSTIFIDVKGNCFASGKINDQMIPVKMEYPHKAVVMKRKRFLKTKKACN